MATSSAMSTSNKYIKYTITVTQNSQSIENNTSNVTVSVRFYRTNTGYTSYGTGTVYCKINGTTYSASVTPSQKITNSGIVLFSKTLNIKHDDDGAKKLTCSAWISHNVVTSSEQSYSQTLTTIPRKSSVSASNGTLGTALALTVTRKSNSFTHTITYSCGSASGTVCTKSSDTSVSWGTSNGNTLALASQNTKGTTVSVTFTITTYNGSTSIGSNTLTVTMSIPSSVKPSCSITVIDAAGYFDTYNSYIQGQSKLKITVTPTLAYGSAIASYSTNANGSTYTVASFTTGVVSSSGTLTITATVKDGRGRVGTASVEINALAYASPQITLLKVKRCVSLEDGTEDINGEFAQVTFSTVITALNDLNSANYVLEYKKASESWDDCVTVPLTDYASNYEVTEGYYRFAADSGSSYNVRVIATDNFTDDTKTTPVSTGEVMEHWRADGKGMGFGKIGEVENGADFGWKIRANKGFINIPLEENTDLNDVTAPNTYISYDKVTSTYVNCPVTSGTFTLEVVSGGNEGQLHQTLTYTSKTGFKVYHRQYYANTWGEWVNTYSATGNLLAKPNWYMSVGQTVTLPQKISEQPTGIYLVFSRYDNGAPLDHNFNCFFVPKMAVSLHSGCNFVFTMNTNIFNVICAKSLTIYDDHIEGDNTNKASGTNNGVTFDNTRYVLRYVIGV